MLYPGTLEAIENGILPSTYERETCSFIRLFLGARIPDETLALIHSKLKLFDSFTKFLSKARDAVQTNFSLE